MEIDKPCNQFHYEVSINGKLAAKFEQLENLTLEGTETVLIDNVIFKNGITKSEEFRLWREEVLTGKILKKRIEISVIFRGIEPIAKIALISSYPVSYIEKSRNIEHGETQIEKIELTYRQIKREFIRKTNIINID